MAETTRWFEDFAPGAVHDLGRRTMTRDEIVAFAADWDPQPMHLDEEAANRSMLRPVRPDDTLALTMTVLDTRTSAKRPRLGLISARFDMTDAGGATALTMTCTLMMERRPTP